MCHLDGTSVHKYVDDPEWHKRDSLIKLWIYGSISKTPSYSIFRDNNDAQQSKSQWFLFHEKKIFQVIKS